MSSCLERMQRESAQIVGEPNELNLHFYGNIEKGVDWALVNRLMKSVAPN